MDNNNNNNNNNNNERSKLNNSDDNKSKKMKLYNNNLDNDKTLRIISIVVFLHVCAVGIVLPSIGDVVLNLFNDNSSEAGLFLAAMSALQSLIGFVCNIFFGNIADQYGRKPFLLMAEVGIIIQGALMGFYQHISLFVILSIIYGLTGVSTTMVNSMIVDITSTFDLLPKNFGLVGGAFGLGFLIGVGLGALVASLTNNNLKIPFLCTMIFELFITLPYTYYYLPETLYVENHNNEAELVSKEYILGKLSNIRKNLGILNSTTRLKFLSLTLFFLTCSASIVSIFLVYTEERYDWKATENGSFMFTFGLAIIIAQVFIVRLMAKTWHPDRSIHFCIALLIISYILWGIAWKGFMMYIVLLICLPALTIAVLLSAEFSKEVAAELQGQLQGGLQSLRVIADVFGALTMGALFSYFVSDSAPFYLPGAAFFLSSIYMFIAWIFHFYATLYESADKSQSRRESTVVFEEQIE